MIEELFKGREARTVELNKSRYLVFPLKDVSFRSSSGRSPNDISHAPAEGFAILQDTQVNGLLVYVNLIRLDGGVIPEKCLYPHLQRVTGVRHLVGSSGWENGPSIYAQGADDRHLSIHCQSERGYERVQAEIYVERLLKIQRNAVRKALAGK